MEGWCLLGVMNECQSAPDAQSPLQRVFVVASISCLASLLIIFWIARRGVEMLEDVCYEIPVYSIIPISVTFTILYRSCWNPEIIGVWRSCHLLLISLFILIGVFLTIAIACFMVEFFIWSVVGGFGPG
jgi:hypothetical protein